MKGGGGGSVKVTLARWTDCQEIGEACNDLDDLCTYYGVSEGGQMVVQQQVFPWKV